MNYKNIVKQREKFLFSNVCKHNLPQFYCLTIKQGYKQTRLQVNTSQLRVIATECWVTAVHTAENVILTCESFSLVFPFTPLSIRLPTPVFVGFQASLIFLKSLLILNTTQFKITDFLSNWNLFEDYVLEAITRLVNLLTKRNLNLCRVVFLFRLIEAVHGVRKHDAEIQGWFEPPA